MNGIKAALSYRLMGVPAWVWGLVIGGAVVAYAYITRGSDGDGPKPAPDAGPSYVDTGGAADAGDVQGVPTVTENVVPVTTNPAWIRVVTDKLVAAGYDPVQVNNALTKGLSGQMLTAQEAALWNEAVRRFGAPPEGAPPITVVPVPTPPPTTTTPPPTTTTPPPATTPVPRYVTVVKFTSSNPPWNSTLSGIASHERTTVAKLMQLNPWIKNPNVIHVGDRVRVA